MAPPTPRSQRQLHNFELPSDLKWFTRSQSTNNPPPRRRWRASSSRRYQPWSDDVASAVLDQSSPKEAPIIDWMNEIISRPSPGGSSSWRSWPRPSGQPTADSDVMIFKANAPPQCREVSGTPPQKSSTLRIRIPSKSGTSSKAPSLPLRPPHAPKLGSSSGGISLTPGSFNAIDKESTFIDLLKSGFTIDKPNNADSRRVGFTAEKTMTEKFDKKFSAQDMNIDEDNHENEGPKEEKKPEDMKRKKEYDVKERTLQIIEGKKEEKPIRTYVRSSRKKAQEAQEKRQEKLVQKKEKDEEYQPDETEDVDSDDLNAKIWNLRTRKPTRKAGVLNLDKKRAGSSSKDEGQSVKEKKNKRVAEGGESKRGDDEKNAEVNKKKDKGKEPMQDEQKNAEVNEKDKGKEPMQEQEEQQSPIRVPKVFVQLSPDEIADDLFALGIGPRPPRRPARRPKHVQRNIDQVTPGMWLEHINMNRYKVPAEKARKGKKK